MRCTCTGTGPHAHNIMSPANIPSGWVNNCWLDQVSKQRQLTMMDILAVGLGYAELGQGQCRHALLIEIHQMLTELDS